MPKAGINLKLGSLLFVVVFAVASLGLYGGSQLVDVEKPAATNGGGGGGGGGVPGGPATLTLTAQNISFDKRSLQVSPGAQVTLTLVNDDAGVLHNVAIYTNNRATQKIAGTEPQAGPVREQLQFTAPAAGNYFFRCDVHPDQMTGTLIVK